MKRAVVIPLALLLVTSCATPAPSTFSNTATPTSKPGEPTKISSPTATHTPWPTLVSQPSAAPQPVGSSTTAANATAPAPAPTRVILSIICPPDKLSPINGYGLVVLSNFIGQPGWNIEITIGNTVCSIPPGTGGFVQLSPGTYPWHAKVPIRGGLGTIQGNITVNPGSSNGEIVFCIVENDLASAPRCPSGGPSLPGGSPQGPSTPLPR
jgi:hypothetical protein